jgi:nucleotide-binding universal stress UspA family protein
MVAGTMSDIERILVATDFSDSAARALDMAVGLAQRQGATLHLLHVYPLLMYALGQDLVPDDPQFEARLRERLQQRLDETLAGLPKDIRAEGSLVQGNPAREIPIQAEKLGAHLIVMGTHGRTGFQHMMLGSVAERALRHASVPVLTVPGPRPAS